MTTFNSYDDFISKYSIKFWFSKHPGKVLKKWNSLSSDSQYSKMEYQAEDESDINHFVQALESGQGDDGLFSIDGYSINRENMTIQVTWCLYLP